ncbi:hypothetical protein E2C01_007266 [Portunus trituberculatus]|uniref:Uncharacterized protein n=1 Tax=Portunus trituberculatus TaxID=210409 RepID=A0A5B7CYR0_PORTR|nr:hypothetical protein [Portunus trituberculatus]
MTRAPKVRHSLKFWSHKDTCDRLQKGLNSFSIAEPPVPVPSVTQHLNKSLSPHYTMIHDTGPLPLALHCPSKVMPPRYMLLLYNNSG